MKELKKSVTASYSRKVNLAHYGGPQYESADFFASFSEELPIESDKETALKTYKRLHKQAREEVEGCVEELTSSMNKCSNCGKKAKNQDKLICAHCRKGFEGAKKNNKPF